jgi:hypothetical protein
MENKKLVLFVVVLLIVSLSCNFLFPDSQSHIPDVNGIGQSVANLPVLDPEAPLPSPGAAQLRTLISDQPGGTALINDMETAEQAAMKAALADLQAKLGPTSNIPDSASLVFTPTGTSALLIPSSARQSTFRDVLLVSYNQTSIIRASDGGLSAATIIGLLTSMFTDIFSPDIAMPTQKFNQIEKEGNVISDMSLEIGKAEDGSDHFSMGLQSEGTENGVTVKTDLSATIDGQRCPTADGQVSFSIKARINSEAGGTGTTQDLTTFVRATVNDDAEIISSTFDITQSTLQVKDGRQVYFESGETIKYGQDYSGSKESNWHVNQNTDNATREDQINLEPAGFKAALELGVSSLASAINAWQSGKCIKIVATSPGTVQPGSTTAIPVNVISRFDGSNAPSKLTAALSGGQSVSPTKLAKTPGTLTYTAPNKNGKSATILLTATSKRGKAKLELSANTGGAAYRVSGISTGVTYSGEICSLDKPFVLSGTFPNGSETLSFTPNNAAGGTVEESGNSGGCTNSGGGSYTVILNEQGPGELQWTDTITSSCPPYSVTKTLTFKLPLNPAPDLSCP